MTMTAQAVYDVPCTPWDLIAEQRNVMRRMCNRDFSLRLPVLKLGWDWEFALPEGTFHNFGCFGEANRRVEDPDFDLRCQLEVVRHEAECLGCSAEVGIPLANTPALDLIHFGTGPLATAFGSEMILREGSQPAFEPAVHTAREAMKLKKPNLLKDGVLPQILERIEYYNEMTQGKVIMSPCDTAGPWSVATSIWHYEDMLEAVCTAPEAVHYLLDLVTECIIEWYNIQEAYIGRWGRTHTSLSWPFLPRGIAIGDDCLVTVSPAMWEEFFMPYNNRLSREYGNLITYHCCMRYDTHFDSIIKTNGFLGFDPALADNEFDRIQAALTEARGVWMQPLGPADLSLINRLRGKIGMIFAVNGSDRRDAIRQARDFLAVLAEPRPTAA